jgi:hypothetical protein
MEQGKQPRLGLARPGLARPGLARLGLDWWTVIVGAALAALVLLGLPALPF